MTIFNKLGKNIPATKFLSLMIGRNMDTPCAMNLAQMLDVNLKRGSLASAGRILTTSITPARTLLQGGPIFLSNEVTLFLHYSYSKWMNLILLGQSKFVPCGYTLILFYD